MWPPLIAHVMSYQAPRRRVTGSLKVTDRSASGGDVRRAVGRRRARDRRREVAGQRRAGDLDVVDADPFVVAGRVRRHDADLQLGLVLGGRRQGHGDRGDEGGQARARSVASAT